MIVNRPRSDYYDDFAESHTFVAGSSDTALHPWEWSEKDTDELVRQHTELMAKKRPIGFTAVWPEDMS